MSAVKVLVVESDKSALQDLIPRLARLGYEVVGSAANKEDALEKSVRLKPALLVMNTRLQKASDGIQTGKLILSQIDVPIVYITSSAGQSTIRRAGSTGPFGYIIRPFDDSQLLATIETALMRHRLESRLRESRQWLNGVLMSIGDGVLAVDQLGNVQFINATAEKITGLKDGDVIGRPILSVLPLKDETSGELLDIFREFSLAGKQERPEAGLEAVIHCADGRIVPLEVNFNPIRDPAGQIQGSVVAFRDISTRRLALQKIRDQAERSKALVQVAKHLNSRLDLQKILDAVFRVANPVIRASASIIFLYDKTSDRYIDIARKFENDLPVAHPNQSSISLTSSQLNQYLPEGKTIVTLPQSAVREFFPFANHEPHRNILHLAVVPLVRNDGLIGALICGMTHAHGFMGEDLEFLKGLAELVVIAISNHDLFEQIRLGRERQRQLSKNVVGIQEVERRRIARELHDHLGQELTGIQFMLEALKGQVEDPQKKYLAEVQQSVTNIIQQVREMSLNLRPGMLDDMGLVPTLKWHLERYTHQTGIAVNFNAPANIGRFPTEIETTAYRIIQEALTNVARHAKISEVFVGILVNDDTLWLEILDNGQGFDTTVVLKKATSGLSVMAERADLAGGHLTINSYIGQGTQVVGALPLTGRPLERRKNDRFHPAGG